MERLIIIVSLPGKGRKIKLGMILDLSNDYVRSFGLNKSVCVMGDAL